MRFFDLITYLLSPPKCAACQSTLGLDFLKAPLCKECLEKLEKEMNETCAECNKPFCKCTCQTKALAEAGCFFHLKLTAYYEGASKRAGNRIVYDMKRSSDKALYTFLADRLSDGVKEWAERAISLSGAKSAVITYVPRSSEAVREYGHDQARLLAQALSHETGIPCAQIVKRKRKANKKMKTLTLEKRFEEAETAYEEASDMPALEGVFVLIADDVITSGASTLAVSRVAMKHKARGFGVISAGTTALNDTKKHFGGNSK